MKLALSFLLLFVEPAWSYCDKYIHEPVVIEQYYQPTLGLSNQELKNKLNVIIRGHTKYSYKCVWEILKQSDEDPQIRDNVIAFYTQRSVPKVNRDTGENDPDSWNREQIWAKSHGFPKKWQHAYTDVHHIRSVNRSVNSDRSDHDFFNGGQVNSECKECREGIGTWEPPHKVKGDVARMMFYVTTRYQGNDGSGTPNLTLIKGTDTPQTRSENGYGHFGDLCTLVRWHLADPVSTTEITRNSIIHSWQGNRNPYIDKPEFVLGVWGKDCSSELLMNSNN